jgi:hypothetical protein
MKTKEEIEKLVEKEYREYPNNTLDEPAWHYNKDIHCHKKRKAFIKGYTQCQEDVDWELLVKLSKRYTEEDMIKFAFDTYCYISGIMKIPFNKVSENRTHAEDNFKDYINSLNKQD